MQLFCFQPLKGMHPGNKPLLSILVAVLSCVLVSTNADMSTVCDHSAT